MSYYDARICSTKFLDVKAVIPSFAKASPYEPLGFAIAKCCLNIFLENSNLMSYKS